MLQVVSGVGLQLDVLPGDILRLCMSLSFRVGKDSNENLPDWHLRKESLSYLDACMSFAHYIISIPAYLF